MLQDFQVCKGLGKLTEKVTKDQSTVIAGDSGIKQVILLVS